MWNVRKKGVGRMDGEGKRCGRLGIAECCDDFTYGTYGSVLVVGRVFTCKGTSNMLTKDDANSSFI